MLCVHSCFFFFLVRCAYFVVYCSLCVGRRLSLAVCCLSFAVCYLFIDLFVAFAFGGELLFFGLVAFVVCWMCVFVVRWLLSFVCCSLVLDCRSLCCCLLAVVCCLVVVCCVLFVVCCLAFAVCWLPGLFSVCWRALFGVCVFWCLLFASCLKLFDERVLVVCCSLFGVRGSLSCV